MAMFELTDLRPSRRTRLHLVFSTVRHPASAFACSSHTLSSSWRSFMVCAVLLSEASMLGCGFIITLLIARLVLLLAGLDYAVTRADALRMAPFGSAVVAIVRLQSYLSSRTAALEAAGVYQGSLSADLLLGSGSCRKSVGSWIGSRDMSGAC